ncbi:hypothetical protein HY490_00110 [Candidatus Woesearchaeota archaeon]|nr:hypothetical protein [Candidatus Woesearchaeota archaeon]
MSEELLNHKHIEQNGDIIEMHIWKVPGSNHHKHIKDRIIPYEFVDEWKLAEDFADDVDKIKRGVIK